MTVLLHLVRAGASPLGVEPGDRVVYRVGASWRLAASLAPAPEEAEPIDDARLHDLIFAAAAVIVW